MSVNLLYCSLSSPDIIYFFKTMLVYSLSFLLWLQALCTLDKKPIDGLDSKNDTNSLELIIIISLLVLYVLPFYFPLFPPPPPDSTRSTFYFKLLQPLASILQPCLYAKFCIQFCHLYFYYYFLPQLFIMYNINSLLRLSIRMNPFHQMKKNLISNPTKVSRFL